MDKFSELKAAALAATPGPWMKIDYFWIGRAGAINSEFITCDNGPDAEYIKRVSPDAVLALLAELEASKQYAKERDAENESLALTVGRLRVELHNEGAANAHAYERIRELEKRLATPVRLPAKVSAQDMRETFNYLMDAEEAQAAANGFNESLIEGRKLLHEQGFTVEGDE